MPGENDPRARRGGGTIGPQRKIAMKRLASWTIPHQGSSRRIELLHGDLSQIPPEHAVDLLVVSAFPNDYTPVRTSLIGALERRGVSVGELARSRQSDLRKDFSCWLSRPVLPAAGFGQILCIESGWRGTPVEITDDLFRAISAACLADENPITVAMPLIGAGNQGFPADVMMASILKAAAAWLKRGLRIDVLKIVIYSDNELELAIRQFGLAQKSAEEKEGPSREAPAARDEAAPRAAECDIFISYCHKDMEAAEALASQLEASVEKPRIFFDKRSIAPSSGWLLRIAESIDKARRVVALLTPNYWSSTYCKEEFMAALTRQYDSGEAVLFPIYFQTAEIPYLFRNLQYLDCRESDMGHLADACRILRGQLRL